MANRVFNIFMFFMLFCHNTGFDPSTPLGMTPQWWAALPNHKLPFAIINRRSLIALIFPLPQYVSVIRHSPCTVSS